MVVWRSSVDVRASKAFCWSLMGIVGGINGVGCAWSNDVVINAGLRGLRTRVVDIGLYCIRNNSSSRRSRVQSSLGDDGWRRCGNGFLSAPHVYCSRLAHGVGAMLGASPRNCSVVDPRRRVSGVCQHPVAVLECSSFVAVAVATSSGNRICNHSPRTFLQRLVTTRVWIAQSRWRMDLGRGISRYLCCASCTHRVGCIRACTFRFSRLGIGSANCVVLANLGALQQHGIR